LLVSALQLLLLLLLGQVQQHGQMGQQYGNMKQQGLMGQMQQHGQTGHQCATISTGHLSGSA
jgi:hypothetical protein